MSGKGQANAKSSGKATGKAASSSAPTKPPAKGQPKGKEGSSAAQPKSSSGGRHDQAKPSAAAKKSGSSHQPQHHSSGSHKPAHAKQQAANKKWTTPDYESPVANGSRKANKDSELDGDDFCVEVITHKPRQQALGRRPRSKQRSDANRRNTVTVPGAHQDRILSILRESTWSNVSALEPRTEPSLEDNIYNLCEFGFRRFEVLQALQYAKNHYDIALDWLMIHLSNEDLPQRFRSSTASAKVEVMDMNSQAFARKRLLRQLKSYGFLENQALRELDAANDDVTQALYRLLESFLTNAAVATMRHVRLSDAMTPEHMDDLKMQREGEISTLQSIMGAEDGEFQIVSDKLLKINFTILVRLTQGDKTQSKIKFTLEVHFPDDNHYPNELPLLAITSDDIISNLKPEVIYAFSRRVVVEAAQYIGQPLIYPIIQWINDQSPRFLPALIRDFDDPIKCADAHEKYFKTLREQDMEKQALKAVKKELRLKLATSSSSPDALDDPNDKEDPSKLDAALKLLTIEEKQPEKPKKRERTAAEVEKLRLKSELLQQKLKENKASNDKYKKMLRAREALPAYQQRSEVLKIVNAGSICLISGATGCGKTTQVAQILLDDMIERGKGAECSIVCTQPRRLSAVSVAERVAHERCEEIGQSVGYSIRLEAQRSEDTQILFMTTGILLRRLQSDPLLQNVSHVLVDEVHERDLNSDFLLIILKKLSLARPDLKLILMSATLNADSFSNYFARCPTLEIPGRTFPVQQFFLEDAIEATGYSIDARSPYATAGRKYKLLEGYSVRVSNVMSLLNRKKINYELIAKLVDYIFEKMSSIQGGILIFMPGMLEIASLIDYLTTTSPNSRKMTILPLHSTLSTEQQQRIFKKPAQGTRKIVVSTNIAETSVTVDDVVFVIDACRVKETRFDGKVESLVEDWTSKASIRQRMGRAGRVQPGFCWSLVAKDRYIHLQDFQDPEMLRVPLDSLVLQIRVLQLGDPRVFLKLALDPPSDVSLNGAIAELQGLSALDEKEHLTPLGFHLGRLPVSPKIGKMLIYSAIFKCMSPILSICAALSDKVPFVSSFENRDEAEDAKMTWDIEDGYSDHLTIVKAYDAWEDVLQRGGNDNSWCRENFLSKPTLINMRDLRKQFRQILKDAGFLHRESFKEHDKAAKREARKVAGDDMNSGDLRLVKAILCAGLFPNIAHLRPHYDNAGGITRTDIITKDQGENQPFIHPTSVLSKVKKFPGNFLVYHDMVQTSKLFLRDVTAIGTYPALLFGGSIVAYPADSAIEMDDWIHLHVSGREGVMLQKLRSELDKLLLAKVLDPSYDISNRKVTNVIVSLIKSESEFA